MIRIGTRIGKYLVGHQIGEGGISDVFEATDESLYGRKVAIKSLKPKFLNDSSSINRFKMEVEILSSLNHNNIMEIREAGVFQSTPYFVAELLTGQDLKQYLLTNGPMSPDMLTNIMIQVLNALQYAHMQGVYHRDIKPSNIFINRAKLVKLLDFGIAKDTHLISELSNSRDIMGSPPYMSPEQIFHNHPIDHRSDLYSLGVTLYTMIEGEHPYVNIPSIYELHKEIIENRLPRLTRCMEFQDIVYRATEKNPADRYQSAEELKLDFIAAAHTLRQEVHTVHSNRRKQLRRRKMGYQLLSLKSILVVVLLVCVLGFFFKIRELTADTDGFFPIENTPPTQMNGTEQDPKTPDTVPAPETKNKPEKKSEPILTDEK